MTKLKIKVISWGQLPFKFDRSKIENLKSDIFEIIGSIETYQINKNSDGEFHEYYDKTVLDDMPDDVVCDFMVAMTNVPLENNWYSRRLCDKIVCFSFFELADVYMSVYRRHARFLADSRLSDKDIKRLYIMDSILMAPE